MFKNVCTAAILTHILIIADCVASKDLQQCNDRCMDICEPCETEDGCTDEEMDCGIEDASPTFQRSCSFRCSNWPRLVLIMIITFLAVVMNTFIIWQSPSSASSDSHHRHHQDRIIIIALIIFIIMCVVSKVSGTSTKGWLEGWRRRGTSSRRCSRPRTTSRRNSRWSK